MADILKDIQKELPRGIISTANFEGANIVLYTEDKSFFLEGEPDIREVVNKIKKRVELRADKDLLLSEEKAENTIKSLIPKEADIIALHFDVQRSVVFIDVRKPGLAIGKGGEILKEIRRQTFWIPQIQRSPAVESKITDSIRAVLYANNNYRKKFLNGIGKRIYADWSPEKKDGWVRVTFLGAGRQVGRSCLLLQTQDSKILLDCGIDMGIQEGKDKFPYLNISEFDIKTLDAVVISHSHLDHVGLLPYLYKMGYRGPCYMTAPTRDIAALLSLDFIGVSYKKAETPLFSMADVKEMVRHSVVIDYNTVTDITSDVRLTFYPAGHALGSAMVHLNIGNGFHNLVYTGDLNYSSTKVLDAAISSFPRMETLITEGTYGGKDNVLPKRADCERELNERIKKTIENGGKVLIPSLGVGRGQEEMLLIEEAIRKGDLPDVPVYIDGMVWDITAIHTAYPNYLSGSVRSKIFKDENPFAAPCFKRVGSPQERKEVVEGGPCIIIATSGMLAGGASVEYFRELADSKKNLIVFTCYQAAGSLGKQVKEGLKDIKMVNSDGKEERVKVNIEVFSADGLSGHSGRGQLMSFVNNVMPRPRKVIVIHGEQSRCLDLASSLYRTFKVETAVPKNLETIRLK
ncbi:beta-CASP ribonuclease aCPSF1 [Nanoarchaeota archaeon]